MSEKQTEKVVPDLFSPWTELPAAGAEAWSKAMSDVVNSESFARAMGEYVESALEASMLLRRQAEAAMEMYLKQMNLSSRQDVIGLAERLTRLEMRLDDLDAKTDEVLDRLKAIQEASVA